MKDATSAKADRTKRATTVTRAVAWGGVSIVVLALYWLATK